MENIERKGPTGALMDEYQKAVEELKSTIKYLEQSDFIKIVDNETKDIDCQSIQNIIEHVISSGYLYSNLIREKFNDVSIERKAKIDVSSPRIACNNLDKMLEYTFENLETKYNLTFDDVINNIIKTSWKQNYDYEQLLEHAIVHILRHRRQIDYFLQNK